MQPDCRIFNNPWVSFDETQCSSEPTDKEAFWWLVEEISKEVVYGPAWTCEDGKELYLDLPLDERISEIKEGDLAVVWTWKDSTGDHYRVQSVCGGWDSSEALHDFLFGKD